MGRIPQALSWYPILTLDRRRWFMLHTASRFITDHLSTLFNEDSRPRTKTTSPEVSIGMTEGAISMGSGHGGTRRWRWRDILKQVRLVRQGQHEINYIPHLFLIKR